MTGWLVRLRGHNFDLAELSLRLRSPDRSVREEGGSYYLTSQQFNSMTDSGEVLQCARELLALANGAMRLELSSYEPVEANELVIGIDEDGNRHRFVHLSGTLKGRGRLRATAVVVKADGSIESGTESVHPVQSHLETAGKDEAVERAIRMFGSRELTMAKLYNVLEIVESGVGGEAALTRTGWAAQADVKRFRQTVNSLQALGEGARHGKEFQAPKNPMTLRQGRRLIGGILKGWLHTKA